ncbi:DUF6868 family protein [Halobacteriovorax sp. HLS]|uniref:DUF6868 family protein n=1 Tax=Halobacteriovorax sp. HLS TaxID=2234000 RepID=UPI000FDBE093|nr:hypothetical protein [Halobacteriovorax sp. HLS]
MTYDLLVELFKWASIIAMTIYIWTAVMCIFANSFIFNIQKKMFNISKDTFDIIIYSYLGLFKIFLILFFIVPYISLLVVK